MHDIKMPEGLFLSLIMHWNAVESNLKDGRCVTKEVK